MRVFFSLVLLLTACAAHDVRCDGRLQPINPPEPRAEPSLSPSVVAPLPRSGPESSGRSAQ